MELKNPSPDDPNKRRQNRTEKQSSDTPSPNRLQELRNRHLRITSLHLDTTSTSEASSSVLERLSARPTEDCSPACKDIMAIERWQSRKEQDQRSDQTRTDASHNKGQGVRDHCLLQYQRYDLYQQSKGKEPASDPLNGVAIKLIEQSKDKEPASDPLNGVAIGENGKPLEKQIVLSEHYGKKNPGLAGAANDMGNICDSIHEYSTIIEYAANVIPEPITSTILKTMVTMIRKDKTNVIDKKLDKLIGGYYNTGSNLLETANLLNDSQIKRQSLANAAQQFMFASNVENDGFMQTKSMFYTGVCYNLLGERNAAMEWYRKAYQKGYEKKYLPKMQIK